MTGAGLSLLPQGVPGLVWGRLWCQLLAGYLLLHGVLKPSAVHNLELASVRSDLRFWCDTLLQMITLGACGQACCRVATEIALWLALTSQGVKLCFDAARCLQSI